jgi:hypothetical protein
MFWKQNPASIETCAHALYEALAKALTQNGRIHVEDLISAAAAIVGERCISAAGDFDPLNHTFPPGQRVFSTNVNNLISGDAQSVAESPAESIIGILRSHLLKCGFSEVDFPGLKDVFTYFAANVGEPEDWGKVPLSISKDHHPFILPLRAAYEMRGTVDKLFAPLGDDRRQKLHAATLTLAETLCKTRDVLDRKIASTLAIETVNGMAKTAPMTDAAMAKIKSGQKA